MLKIDKNINYVMVKSWNNNHDGKDIFWIHYDDGLWVIALKDGNFIATTEVVTVFYKSQ
jgi:hypothetical protein